MMMLRSAAVLALILTGTTASFAQDCSSYGIANAFGLVSGYMQSHPETIFNAQLQFNSMGEFVPIATDGVWGPSTAGRVCVMLNKYEAVNGMAPDDLIRTQADAAYFVDWIGSMARSNLNPNFEAPD